MLECGPSQEATAGDIQSADELIDAAENSCLYEFNSYLE